MYRFNPKNWIGLLIFLAGSAFTGCRQSAPELPDPEERLRRIKLDFTKTGDEIKASLSRYYPSLSDSLFHAWESDGRLESLIVEGEKKYFKYAVNNLFRVDPDAGKVRDSIIPPVPDPLDSIRQANTSDILGNGKPGEPAQTLLINIRFTLTVDQDAVPSGEQIRCWLPFPRESPPRQSETRLVSSDPPGMKKPKPKDLHSALYATKIAEAGKPTIFSYQGSFQISGQWFDPELLNTIPTGKKTMLPKQYLHEAPPQVIFSPDVKRLADRLAGDEKDPFKVFRSFYYWIDHNIPWASAREYSTMDSIPDYVLKYRRGDCGMVTFLLMSMLRYKGIPARWQSGWMLHPGEENLHDWCEVWLPGTGWVPVDMSFGLQKTDDGRLKEFYLSGIDSYRMIVNDDFGRGFQPPKRYPRSEPFDFQRGEVEWKGGNLYFDSWDYHLEVISIQDVPKKPN